MREFFTQGPLLELPKTSEIEEQVLERLRSAYGSREFTDEECVEALGIDRKILPKLYQKGYLNLSTEEDFTICNLNKLEDVPALAAQRLSGAAEKKQQEKRKVVAEYLEGLMGYIQNNFSGKNFSARDITYPRSSNLKTPTANNPFFEKMLWLLRHDGYLEEVERLQKVKNAQYTVFRIVTNIAQEKN